MAEFIENTIGENSHRISAHRALLLNPTVPKVTEALALAGLRTGWAAPQASVVHRSGNRWQRQGSIALLNDFDSLIQALFADQARKSLETHRKVRAGDMSPAEPTKFEQLIEIWERLLPHRKLHISGDDIKVTVAGSNTTYLAAQMSDGERAIFYMIGQTLLAADTSVLIFDEPELHVHRSIMAKLWDELEATRQDCAFVFVTHDLEFAATRVAQKFIIRDFDPTPSWNIELVPENTGFGEEVTTLILGSRRPILFVEGTENSLDLAIYRSCFPEWTVIPRGSCEEVIYSVVTMRRNRELTRVTCSGIVDADDYEQEDIARLGDLGVAVLPVSEIENIILLPDVSRYIAEAEGYEGAALSARLESLKIAVLETLNSSEVIDLVIARYCRRRIDRHLKKIDLSQAKTVPEMLSLLDQQVSKMDISEIAKKARARVEEALRAEDLPKLLANYDNKGLIALAASHLKRTRAVDFESWLIRVLRNNSVPKLADAIRAVLPRPQAK